MEIKTHRRDFLKKTAAAAILMAAGGLSKAEGGAPGTVIKAPESREPSFGEKKSGMPKAVDLPHYRLGREILRKKILR